MTVKPRSIILVGIIQVLLAASFVIWLIFFPGTADRFAWPVTPVPTAMFIGAGFIVRTMIGYFLWREKYWYRLRWQSWGNYTFLALIFLATYWHIDEMNWKTSIIVAHIWVVAYTVEPLLLPLMEPWGEKRKEPFPEAEIRGPVLPGMQRIAAAGMVVSTAIAALMVLNPAFLNTRWPWELDPFNARVMAAFLGLAAVWCLEIYLARDWVEVRLAALGLVIFTLVEFIVWLVNLPGFDRQRENIAAVGIGFGVFMVLLAYFYIAQERAAVKRGASHG